MPDDSSSAAWHEGATGILHFHPRLARKTLVLHELDHWLEPVPADHGQRWLRTYRALLAAELGDEAADVFDQLLDDACLGHGDDE